MKKWLIWIAAILAAGLVTLFLFVVTGVVSVARISHLHTVPDHLEIDRQYRTVDASIVEIEEADLGNGMFRRVFFVPPSFFYHGDHSSTAVDPFAAPEESKLEKVKTAQAILEDAGIIFEEGASAVYNRKLSALTIVNTPDQLELVEAFMSGCILQSRQIAIRVEIYELPMKLAMEALESAAGESRHNAERDAIRKLLGRGPIRLVNAVSLNVPSGQRAKVEDVFEFPMAIPKSGEAEEEKEASEETDWEMRQVGTILEVDPVLGADDFTIDVSMQLEHHTADPVLDPLSENAPAQFHAKKVTTQITLISGSQVLVGSWKPSGKPEYENGDLMQIAFLSAHSQSLSRIVEVKEGDEKKE